MSPYRKAAEAPLEASSPRSVLGDEDLWPIFAVVWVGSVARVLAALLQRELFDVEPTLALCVVVAFPVGLLRRLLRARRDRRRS
jgi:hypothetical protein